MTSFLIGVFAWTTDDCLYMIDDGKVQYLELLEDKRKEIDEVRKNEQLPPIITLEDVLQKQYLIKDGTGIIPMFAIIDQGGHKADEVKYFVHRHRNVFSQKGTAMTTMNWKLSDNQEKLIVTNEKYWKSSTIFYLYSQKNRNENFLFFYPEISEESLSEIRSLKPDDSSRWGQEPANWISKDGKDHAFDILKYAYLARDFALQSFSKSRYRFGKAPSILRRFEKERKVEEQKQQIETKRSGWFS